ncbi:MAG: hypothetical protein ACYC5Q_08315 [Thermoleophilia bacterium]
MELRSRYAGLDRPALRSLHPLSDYDAYFRRFGKSYHVQPPLRLEAARGTESFMRLDGTEQHPKIGDMFITDAEGIISCVLNGPDRRTRITPENHPRTLHGVRPARGASGGGGTLPGPHPRTGDYLVTPGARIEDRRVVSGG